MSQRSGQMDELHRGDSGSTPPPPARSRPTTPERPRNAPSTPTRSAPSWRTPPDRVGFDARAAAACYDRQAAPQLVTDDDRARLFALIGVDRGRHRVRLHLRPPRRDPVRGRVGRRPPRRRRDRRPGRRVADHRHRRDPRDRPTATPAPATSSACDDGRVVGAVEGDALYTTRQMLDIEQRLIAGLRAGPPHRRRRGARGHGGGGARRAAPTRRRPGRRWCVPSPAPASASSSSTARPGRARRRRWRRRRGRGRRPASGHRHRRAGHPRRDRGRPHRHREPHGGQPARGASTRARSPLASDRRPGRRVLDAGQPRPPGPDRPCAEAGGAALRLVGDPAQHTAVAAGGAWRHLLDDYPQDRAELTSSAARRARRWTTCAWP